MKTHEVFTSMGSTAELWSDDTYTLHFGAGFDEECESTPELLWEAVSTDSLKFIAECGASANDRGKALAALAEADTNRSLEDELMYVDGRGYKVGTWGDIVERGNYE